VYFAFVGCRDMYASPAGGNATALLVAQDTVAQILASLGLDWPAL
jgi:hypothetical protein